MLICTLAHGPKPGPEHECCHAAGIGCSRWCVNPRHLRWGTRGENAADRVLDGRPSLGRPKLTAEQVDAIRARIAAGQRQVDVAGEFGVHPSTVGNIASGRTWGNADPSPWPDEAVTT